MTHVQVRTQRALGAKFIIQNLCPRHKNLYDYSQAMVKKTEADRTSEFSREKNAREKN